jgi:uncharacterized membrane protein
MGPDLLSQYEIPYLHPLAVHFPLVLLLLGAGAAVVYAAFGRAVWRQAALVLFALGALGAFAAGQTGEAMEHDVEGSPVVDAFLATHEAAAGYTLWAAVLAASTYGGLTVRARRYPADAGREPVWGRLGALAPALAAAALVAYTAHLGGVMVWGVPAG